MLLLASSVCGLFKWRQFEPEVILLAVGWYLRFSLSYRDVEELLAERGLHADHVTVCRWVQRYAPEMERRLRSRLKFSKRLTTSRLSRTPKSSASALISFHVFFKRLVAGVDHHRTVKARFNAIVTGSLVAMVEVHGKHGIRENFFGLSNYNFQHPFVRIFPGTFRQLNDKGRLRLDGTFEQAQGLLHVVDVVGTNSVLPVRKLKEV
jgi:hypothetical protein